MTVAAPPKGPVLTAAETRAAEQALFDSGVKGIDLMEKAGAAVADAIVQRYAPAPTLVLCGPGNNGGDGYIVARLLRERGWPVRVAAQAPPGTKTAAEAKARWNGPVENLREADPADYLIDALFGIGLSRPLAPDVADRLCALAAVADQRIAIDVPSGVATDDGRLMGEIPCFDLTVALGALKPVHVHGEARKRCGTVVLGDIGLPVPSEGC